MAAMVWANNCSHKVMVKRVLGRGAFGRVLLGEELATGRQCALKICLPLCKGVELFFPTTSFKFIWCLTISDPVGRVSKEAEILNKLSGVAGVIQLVASQDNEEASMIMMEAAKHGDLHDYMNTHGRHMTNDIRLRLCYMAIKYGRLPVYIYPTLF